MWRLTVGQVSCRRVIPNSFLLTRPTIPPLLVVYRSDFATPARISSPSSWLHSSFMRLKLSASSRRSVDLSFGTALGQVINRGLPIENSCDGITGRLTAFCNPHNDAFPRGRVDAEDHGPGPERLLGFDDCLTFIGQWQRHGAIRLPRPPVRHRTARRFADPSTSATWPPRRFSSTITQADRERGPCALFRRRRSLADATTVCWRSPLGDQGRPLYELSDLPAADFQGHRTFARGL
jgi:hypothetical protein